ncbi:MAG: Flp pilus assembly protein CpaB [Bdellovibrionales bacterium RIFOXYA1_FULL_36_14]|nr:MAG: Flp pilus assembly protein CpaB [Bdellovibrionales bacterium RIFOXYA1_FULL_36_14]
MNTRSFSLALILALLAMVIVWTYVDSEISEVKKEYGQAQTVIVASRDINELELIDDSMIDSIAVPMKFAQPGNFKSKKELMNTVAMVAIKKGEQITKPRVDYPGVKTGLSRQVSPDKRAIAILVSDRTAVSKLVKPGDRVDVLAWIDYGSGRKDIQKVSTVLQDVMVLSTGFDMTNSLPMYGRKTDKVIEAMKLNTYSNYTTVTLEVTSFEAQQLVFLLNFNTDPYLVLRNNNDRDRVKIKPTKVFDVLGDDAQEAKLFFQQKYSEKK